MLTYAALGDSITVGTGACPGGGLVPQYRSMTEKRLGQCVYSINLGISGATTGDLLRVVHGSPEIRHILARADIITITAGGNDLIRAAQRYAMQTNPEVLQQALVQCRENYGKIVDSIRKLKANRSRPYIIRAVDLYNPLPQVPAAAGWVQRLGQHIESLECANFQVARIYSLFAGREKELLSSDKIHPNAAGYRVMAQQMSQLGYRPLG